MLGLKEIVLIAIVVLLLFGPSKLPQLGEGIGKMLRGFKKEMRALDDEARDAKPASSEGSAHEIDVTPKASASATPREPR